MSDIKNYDWLIAGLGNPGNIYEKTRHNIGWMVLDYMCEKFDMEFTHRMYFNDFDFNLHENKVAFIKPNIFMNNSGEPIKRFSDKYQIPPERIVVICDEFNFSVGKVHLRSGGSDGGHNGIASVIEKLGTQNFLRLRCGIGNDFMTGELSNYVLSEFLKSQKDEVRIMVKKAADAIECIIENGADKAMQIINSSKISEQTSEKEL